MPAPSITGASTNSISGTASSNSNIEVFIYDDVSCSVSCQGRYFLGSTTADSGGNWQLDGASFQIPLLEGNQVTATATDLTDNTDIPTLRRILAESRTIAMVGLSANWHMLAPASFN